MIDIKQIFKNMRAERTRFFLTIFAVAWGTASITCMLAIGEGLRLAFGNAMLNTGNGILIVEKGNTSLAYRGHEANEAVNLNEQDYAVLKKSQLAIANMSAEYSTNFLMQYASQQRHGATTGVEPSYGAMRDMELLPGGRFINQSDQATFARVAVIGDDVAKQLFSDRHEPKSLAVGKFITINQIPFLVIGVLKSKMQMYVYTYPPDNVQTYIPASTFYSLWHPQHINDIVIQPLSLDATPYLKSDIQKIIALQHGVSPNDPSILLMKDSAMVQKKIETLFTTLEWFLGIIGGMTLLVAGIGIANVMFISVKQNTREIGIRMTVGARSRQILSSYIIEALVGTSLGGMIGLIVSECIIWLISYFTRNADFFVKLGHPTPIISAHVVLYVILTLGCIGLLAGFFPARKASLIDPAEALRYE